ncbi:ribosomal protein S13 (chloroplast) [Guillardia theta]|uniref:Small ribosomal subunit protein uS13c n=2 Tax=Guillardia theta TaxID=55529 RepID=RR13_GUITH|nr:ribosomal protein S13 [Guillardia theta]O46912.1 RecName: Full=Small ribosomal subunit protein uS13c; AltName: Full=30S ribosomal protein S13, chloroplastic [Guillardia theta]AAC35722.1 ribosomal protein S13 [Guillardia theta]
MARISGIDLPKNKRIEIALTYIYGVGLSSSQKILEKANIDANKRCKDLDDNEVSLIRSIIDENYPVEGAAKRVESMNIKRLMEINCIRGKRHRVGLPLRGQRTRTNARTRRGAKKTVAGKKK